jgi:hypothetical protein
MILYGLHEDVVLRKILFIRQGKRDKSEYSNGVGFDKNSGNGR